jgi:hypothetical protein
VGPRARPSGFPVGMSAAADDPRHAAGRVSVVASIGYVAFLAGPPLIGFPRPEEVGNAAGAFSVDRGGRASSRSACSRLRRSFARCRRQQTRTSSCARRARRPERT